MYCNFLFTVKLISGDIVHLGQNLPEMCNLATGIYMWTLQGYKTGDFEKYPPPPLGSLKGARKRLHCKRHGTLSIKPVVDE